MIIEIPPKMEEEILKHAEILGRTPEKVVMDFLWTRFSPPVKPKNIKPRRKPKKGERTLYDALKDHIGVIHSGERYRGGARMTEHIDAKTIEEREEIEEYLRKNRIRKE